MNELKKNSTSSSLENGLIISNLTGEERTTAKSPFLFKDERTASPSESSATQFRPDEDVLIPVSPIPLRVIRQNSSSTYATEATSRMYSSYEEQYNPKTQRKIDYLQSKYDYIACCYELDCLKKMRKCLSKTKDPFLHSNQSQLEMGIKRYQHLKNKAKEDFRKQKIKRIYYLFHLN